MAAPVTSACWSGGLMASGSADGSIKLWNAETGQEVRTLLGHVEGVTSLLALPDGLLVSGSRGHTVAVCMVRRSRAAASGTGQVRKEQQEPIKEPGDSGIFSD